MGNRGRPKGWRKDNKIPYPKIGEKEVKPIDNKETEMPEAKVKVLSSDEKTPPKDELDKKQNVCPWCNYSNDDEEKGPVHKKESNQVRNTGHKYQCDICGKNWEKLSLGKPWTEALEKGPAWEREMRARQLREI